MDIEEMESYNEPISDLSLNNYLLDDYLDKN